jgi:hypothetical protein
MESVYRLDIGNHMAQQNITRSAEPVCSTLACRVALLGNKYLTAAVGPIDWLNRLSLPPFDGIVPSAHAQPILATTQAILPGQFLERYGRDHVIVKIQAVSYSAAMPPGGPTYRIHQNIGGVVQMFPIAMLKAQSNLPTQMFVGNTKKSAQTVYLVTNVHYPPGFEGLPISIPTEPRTLQPGESFVMKGTVGNTSADTTPHGICGTFSGMLKIGAYGGTEPLATSLLMVGGLGIGGLAFLRRRKPESNEEEREEDKV